ncbi:MAG: alpha/beta hydrolase [Betaproteobacteria bacterium HGW-Betaproteobacteria-22]|nr:MAG: alpha/beta hydrolase [Betaproteobacteria bacterium HGW-Betaproteobacteria-22]
MIFRLLFLTLCLTACVQVPNVSERIDFASSIATQKGWKSENIETDLFTLRAYLPQTLKKTETLNVYIEGDGLAWVSSSTPSFDPTPINPLALKLAMLDTGASVYLARPCQFTGAEQQHGCAQKYWTSHRFSPEVIGASNDAVSQLKLRFSANKVRLIGYSGGGAVAALIAARRDDVTKLITIAGNLDHQAWTAHHSISPLSNSLNPADYREALAGVRQVHFVGEDDKVIPPFIANNFVASLPKTSDASVIVVPKQSHSCCWENRWSVLLYD